jgi:hypothetical protein
MFAATVLRPGEYDVRNALSDASAHLVVHALDHRPASEPQPDPVEIQCRPDAFNPSEIEIVQGIGQSYQCVAPSRITITPVASAT